MPVSCVSSHQRLSCLCTRVRHVSLSCSANTFKKSTKPEGRQSLTCLRSLLSHANTRPRVSHGLVVERMVTRFGGRFASTWKPRNDVASTKQHGIALSSSRHALTITSGCSLRFGCLTTSFEQDISMVRPVTTRNRRAVEIIGGRAKRFAREIKALERTHTRAQKACERLDKRCNHKSLTKSRKSGTRQSKQESPRNQQFKAVFPFPSLPGEMRNRIYEFTLAPLDRLYLDTLKAPTLAGVSKQVGGECLATSLQVNACHTYFCS